MSQQHASIKSAARTAVACGFAALAVVLVAVTALLGTLLWNASGSTDFDRVAPEEMADRAFRQSQQAYEVLGLGRTIQPGHKPEDTETENEFGTDYCYDGGLLGLEDNTLDGAYRLSHGWSLDHVTEAQAEAALRRMREHLQKEDTDWKITDYSEGGRPRTWRLSAERNDGDDGRMHFDWDPARQTFTGSTGMPCAYDPTWIVAGTVTWQLPDLDAFPPALTP